MDIKPVVVKNLKKCFGGICAVNDLSLTIEPGEIFGLLGPNGAGKTTFISMLTTLEKPDSGEISIFGRNMATDARAAKMSIGVVSQELISHGFFTVQEIIDFQAGYYGLRIDPIYNRYLLKRLHLWCHRDKLARALSGGMKRRLMIAKALVHKPKLLLLDEPSAGVDVELRGEMWEFIRELHNEGTTILLTTHYLEEAENLCDRIGIISHGSLRCIETPQAIVDKLTFREVTVTLKKGVNLHIQSSYLQAQEGSMLVFHLPQKMPFADLLREVQLDLNLIHDLKIQEGTLEDAFMQVVNQEARSVETC